MVNGCASLINIPVSAGSGLPPLGRSFFEVCQREVWAPFCKTTVVSNKQILDTLFAHRNGLYVRIINAEIKLMSHESEGQTANAVFIAHYVPTKILL